MLREKNRNLKVIGGVNWGAKGTPPTSRSDFFYFHAVFGKKSCQIMGFASNSGVGALPFWEILDPPLKLIIGAGLVLFWIEEFKKLTISIHFGYFMCGLFIILVNFFQVFRVSLKRKVIKSQPLCM